LLTDDGGAGALAWWDRAVPTAGTLAERCVRRAAWRTRPLVSPRAAVSPELPVRRRPPSLPADALSRHPPARAAGNHADRARAGCPQDRPLSVLSGPRLRDQGQRRPRRWACTSAKGSKRRSAVLSSAGATRAFPALAGIEALNIFTETGDASANVRAVRECASRWIGREVADRVPKAGDERNDALTA
jgi:hypothetical protein